MQQSLRSATATVSPYCFPAPPQPPPILSFPIFPAPPQTPYTPSPSPSPIVSPLRLPLLSAVRTSDRNVSPAATALALFPACSRFDQMASSAATCPAPEALSELCARRLPLGPNAQ